MNKLTSNILFISVLLLSVNMAFSAPEENVIGTQEALRNAIDSNDAVMIGEILVNTRGVHSSSAIEDCEEDEYTSPINLGSLLRRAALKGCAECIDTLIDFGAPIDERGLTQDTAAYWAVKKGHVDAVEALLKGGVNPNEKCALGRSLLHWADKKLCEKLEDFEATQTIENLKEIETFEAIASLLIEYGAKESAHSSGSFDPSIGGFGGSPSKLFGTPVFKVYP